MQTLAATTFKSHCLVRPATALQPQPHKPLSPCVDYGSFFH